MHRPSDLPSARGPRSMAADAFDRPLVVICAVTPRRSGEGDPASGRR